MEVLVRQDSNLFSEISHSNKAFNLAYFELLGNVDLINNEMDSYRKLTVSDLSNFANKFLLEENSSVIYYASKSSEQ